MLARMNRTTGLICLKALTFRKADLRDPGLCLEFTFVGLGWRQRFLSALLRS
jgi:hypothetical protein